MNNKQFDARSMGSGKPKSEPGLGDDAPCSKCGSALDTGLECTECGHDMRPEIYPAPVAGLSAMKTEQLFDREGITLESAKPFAFSCCDCGLTHRMVIVSEDGKPVGFAVERLAERAPRPDALQPLSDLNHELGLESVPAGVQGDAARLDFVANSPSRYVEKHPTNGMWRVYEDKAPATAVAADWQAMTIGYHATPSAAIDAAIASQAGKD